jgi:hypothetical protein
LLYYIPGFISRCREFHSAWGSAWDFSADTDGDGITGVLIGVIAPSSLITLLTYPIAGRSLIAITLGAADDRGLAVLAAFAARLLGDSLALNMEQERSPVSLDLIPAPSAASTTGVSREGTPFVDGRALEDCMGVEASTEAVDPTVEVEGDAHHAQAAHGT